MSNYGMPDYGNAYQNVPPKRKSLKVPLMIGCCSLLFVGIVTIAIVVIVNFESIAGMVLGKEVVAATKAYNSIELGMSEQEVMGYIRQIPDEGTMGFHTEEELSEPGKRTETSGDFWRLSSKGSVDRKLVDCAFLLGGMGEDEGKECYIRLKFNSSLELTYKDKTGF